jgi:cytochrome c peroxidase
MDSEHSSGRRRLAVSLGLLGALTAVSAAQERVIGNFPVVAVPPENPLTPEKVLLGMALFFEEQMSADDTMACATCHLPEGGGGDPNGGAREAGADQVLFTADDEFGSAGVVLQDAQGDFRHHALYGVGRQPTPRNSPSAINAAFFQALFWDQRALPVFRDEADQVVLSDNAALESQAVGPFVSSVEMGHEGQTWAELTVKLGCGHSIWPATCRRGWSNSWMGARATDRSSSAPSGRRRSRASAWPWPSPATSARSSPTAHPSTWAR